MTSIPPLPRLTEHEPLGWQGFALKKDNNQYYFHSYRDHDNRNSSTAQMVYESCEKNSIKDFDWILFCVQDVFDWELNEHNQVIDANGRGFPYYSYHTNTEDYERVIPDYIFDHWSVVGLDDYETTRKNFKNIGSPKFNCIGWRGAINVFRQPLVNLDDKVDFDCEVINWNHSNPKKLTATNYLSFDDLVNNYRYLIDVRGRGWSGRLKLLLCAPRVTFIVEREFKEFFFPYLQPWYHYVPVKEDYSDLKENLHRIKSDNELETFIIKNAQEFADKHLTRQSALDVLSQKLIKHIGSKP